MNKANFLIKDNKPKLTGDLCKQCAAPLNEYHLFFGKDKCSSCEPIYLLRKNNNDAIQSKRIGNDTYVDNGNENKK